MKKNLIIRFGKIGDIISILNYAEIHNYDIFHSYNKVNFLLNRSNSKLLPMLNSKNVINGGILFYLNIIKRYNSVIFYSQSDNINGRIFCFIINLLSHIYARKKVIFYFSGSQYFYQINNNSNVKKLINSNIRKVLICYESEESANNLSIKTINKISEFLFFKYPGVDIKILGKNYIPVNNKIINLTSKTSIDELFDFIKNSDIVITCDSGPLHIASYYNKTTIGFISARQNMINWLPIKSSNYYIYDDMISCSNCNKRYCPRGLNICVNSDLNINKFYEIFE